MKVCCVFNYNPLYRYPIYSAMAEKFDCDFFFGDTVFEPLKSFDANKLKGFKGFIEAKKTGIKGYIWHSNISQIFNKKYTHYVLTGDYSMIVNWLIICYAKLFRRKVFLWCHGVKSEVKKKRTRLILHNFFTSVTGILMYNHYNCKYMEMIGCEKERLHVIHNSLNTPEQTRLYKELLPSNIYKDHFGNDYPVVIYIGRIQKRMKVDMIIEAVKRLQKQNILVNAVIVGSYMDGVDITQMVKEYKLEKQVWMYGPSFDENVNSELLYNADVCVAPGTVGLTAIHSLSYGTPCVTHSNHSATGPEFEAIIDGCTGSFFVEDDIESLMESIKLWTNKTKQEREETRAYARKEIESNWSIDSQISLLSKVLV